VTHTTFTVEEWRRQQATALEMTVGMLIVAALCCALWRWLHDVDCWIEM